MKKEKETSRDLVDTLTCRRGFRHWWDNVDEDTQEEIIAEMAEIIFEKQNNI